MLQQGGPRRKEILARSKRRRRMVIVAVGSFLAILVMISLLSRVASVVATRLIKTVNPTWGVIEQVDSWSGFVIRDEHLLLAPLSGEWEALGTEGNKVRAGQKVMRLAQVSLDSSGIKENTAITVTVPGVLCYHPDGWEAVLRPEALDSLKWDMLKDYDPGPIPKGPMLKNGEPAAKIIANLTPVFFWGETSGPGSWEIGIDVALKTGDEEFASRVEAFWKLGDKVLLLLATPFDERLLHTRRLDADLVLSRWEGLIIPSSAVESKGEEKGVYLIRGDRTEWVPVVIRGGDQENLVVEGLDARERVVINPSLIDQM